MNKRKLINELNYHFPSYEAVDGDEFGKDFTSAVWFMGENAYANLMSDHDENNNYVYDHVTSRDCPVIKFLEMNGWYVEPYDEITALAYQDTDFINNAEK